MKLRGLRFLPRASSFLGRGGFLTTDYTDYTDIRGGIFLVVFGIDRVERVDRVEIGQAQLDHQR